MKKLWKSLKEIKLLKEKTVDKIGLFGFVSGCLAGMFWSIHWNYTGLIFAVFGLLVIVGLCIHLLVDTYLWSKDYFKNRNKIE